MFEKEAEEWVKNNLHNAEEDYIKAFKDGADLGYNKANEWHYVKDGDLPKENKPLLCVRGGNIYIAWYYNGVYHDNRCCQVKKPYAWKEIVPPKESE